MTHDELRTGELRTGPVAGRRSVLGALSAVPAAAALWSLPGTAAAQPSAPARIPAGLRPGGELDQLIARLAAEDKFSGTVLLVHRDRPVLSRSYGMADQQRSVPIGPDTIFALGSVNKIFTAIAVAQLVQAGKIAYHEKLGAYLDGFTADIADTVTVHHLLTHTSGLGDHMRSADYQRESATWASPEQVMEGNLKFVRKLPLLFPPGAGHEYSNAGYHALGEIVAKISGLSYYDYVRERVFRPAGMTSTDFYTKPQWQTDPRIAHPYTTQPSGTRVDATDRHAYMGYPASNSFANATDLVRFTKALLGNKLLNPLYTQLALSPKIPSQPLAPAPGMAAMMPFKTYTSVASLINNQWVAGNSGGAPGIFTTLEWYPNADWVAVTLSNYDMGTTTSINSLARKLITKP